MTKEITKNNTTKKPRMKEKWVRKRLVRINNALAQVANNFG